MGNDTLRSNLIETMIENQKLKEDNASLRDSLKKTYDFMEEIILDGKNMLERFRETLSEMVMRTVDKMWGAHKR